MVRGHAQHNHGLATRPFPHRSRMAHRAVETHLLGPKPLAPRNPDRHIVVRNENKPPGRL